jgi:hypothetical protein
VCIELDVHDGGVRPGQGRAGCVVRASEISRHY